MSVLFFFFNDTATPDISTLSLHDALPISRRREGGRRRAWGGHARSRRREPARRDDRAGPGRRRPAAPFRHPGSTTDRKSTRLNSSHSQISYAVFCLKKKKFMH